MTNVNIHYSKVTLIFTYLLPLPLVLYLIYGLTRINEIKMPFVLIISTSTLYALAYVKDVYDFSLEVELRDGYLLVKRFHFFQTNSYSISFFSKVKSYSHFYKKGISLCFINGDEILFNGSSQYMKRWKNLSLLINILENKVN